MNIYEKLQTCRVELQNMSLKKSGQNKYSGFSYYELGDFLPAINTLFSKYKLFASISFVETQAYMTIRNAEKPEEVVEFTSPVADANVKGCQPIQNLGAVQTYMRRYLYMLALEIVECDALDATAGAKEKELDNAVKASEDKSMKALSNAEKLEDERKIQMCKVIYTVADRKGVDKNKIKEVIKKQYNANSLKDCTIPQLMDIKAKLESKPDAVVDVPEGLFDT